MSVDTDMNISPVIGTGADDSLTGTGRSEVLSGDAGDDTIAALSGNDEVFGGTGNDILYGQGGDDVMYGNGKPSYVDMSNLVMQDGGTATVTFMDEGAGYRNSLGSYEIDADGNITNVQIIFANASKEGSGGNLKPGESQMTFEFGDNTQLGFFVISNGYGKGYENRLALEDLKGEFIFLDGNGEPGSIHNKDLVLYHKDPETGELTPIKSQYGTDTYHSYGSEADGYGPNSDNYLHVVARANTLTGELLMGFEDLRNGGDNDYDDTVIKIEIGRENLLALLPEKAPAAKPKPDNDILYGGDGDDTMYGVSGDDELHGGRGNDTMQGNSGDDVLYGNDGDDIMEGNSGNDVLYGGSGNDEMQGNSGNDTLLGGNGKDTISGGSGNDTILGGSGDDVVDGNSGHDIIYGGSGNDVLNGNSGNDVLSGDTGNDLLNGNSGDDLLYGGDGQDKLIGGSGNDQLYGGAHNDKVYGGSGADVLYGGSGDDYLTAGSGDDRIIGGAGNDKMIGGIGSDTFVFEFDSDETGSDCIYDFSLEDFLEFQGALFSSFEELLEYCTQDGDDLIIQWGEDCSVELRNISIDDLNPDHFIFA